MSTERSIKNSTSKILIVIFSILGAVISAHLLYSHYMPPSSDSLLFRMCSASGVFDCEAVNTSKYSILFGLPVALWGLMYYIFMISCILFRESESEAGLKNALDAVMLSASLISAAMVIPLFIISTFLIHALCLFCIITWIINIIIFIMMIFMVRGRDGAPFLSSMKINFESAFSLLPGIYRNLKIILFALYMIILSAFFFTLDRYMLLYRAVTEAERIVQKENEFIERFYETPVSPVETGHTPVFAGNPEAKITVVDYMNFNCPACRKAHAGLKPVVEKYGDRVKLYLKNYPLDGQCNPHVERKMGGLSCTASLVAVGLYGDPGYHKYVASIMRHTDRLNPRAMLNAVGAAGIDVRRADIYIKSADIRRKLTEEINQASTLGINATPTFIVNGRVLPAGAINPQLFERLLRMEIKRMYGE